MSHAEHYITPKKTLIQVFAGLIILTALTVATSRMDLGAFNVPLALLIAFTKATLVVLIFMALRHDNRVNAVVFAVGSAFVLVFLVFTLLDTSFRGDLPNTFEGTIMDEEIENEALRARDPGPPPPPPAPDTQ